MGQIRRSAVAQRTDGDGTVFDSASELRQWKELQLLQRAGKIAHLQRQVPYPLAIEETAVKIRSDRYPNGRQVVYVCDFVYLNLETGIWVYLESKGYWTAEARLKVALFEACYGVRVTVVGAAQMPGRRSVARVARSA